MTNLILIAVLLAQITQIVILLRRIDKPDFSKEDQIVKHLDADVEEAQRHLPPQN